MRILRNISILWTLLFTLIIFMLLFKTRYPKKKANTITLATMLPLILVNFVLALVLDADTYGTLLLVTLSLPSLIVFWIMAKHRDGRFFFTFCLVDTVSLEILYITQIINYYTTPDTYIVIFVLRLIAYPLLGWFTYKKIRPAFPELQENIKKGWGIFAAISAIFYVAQALLTNYPTSVTERPEYLPALILIYILMPLLYIQIFRTLQHQKNIHEMSERENILNLQVSNMTTRIEEFSSADEKFRIERHNFRHKMQTISSLIEKKQYNELNKLVSEYNEAIKETQVKRYCSFAIIDAVLSSYILMAERRNIKVRIEPDFPASLSVNEAELATVIANAIENAVHACEKLPEQERFIRIKVLNSPRFMIQVSNSFNGEVVFDKNGIPVTNKEGHGFGTRSIIAFCEKNNVFYEFKADKSVFYLRLAFA